MKIALAILASAALAGCIQTTPQQQARRLTSADDPTMGCLLRMDSDQQFQALIVRLGSVSYANRATIQMMASKERPTEDEKSALSNWGLARQACVDQGRSFRAANAPPAWTAAFTSSQNQLLQAIAALYSGELTYGQFISERQRISDTAARQLQEASDADVARNNQQRQMEQARSDAALQMFLQNQQANKPVNTTCNRFMNTVNCTTR